MPRSSVAIVGAGFSGATLATQILALAQHAAPRIFLIDRSGRFGPGLAYSTPHAGHLMNVRAGRLSLSPDRADDFVEWLSSRADAGAGAAQFAPRSVYGAYLEAQVRRAARDHELGSVNFVREAVVSCRPHATGVRIALQSGAALEVDAAVLALGNQTPAAPAKLDELPEIASRLINPWSAEFARIRPEDNVLLLGAGLTMVDAMVSLTASPRRGTVFALSRHGLLPRAHADQPSNDNEPFWVEGELSAMLMQMRREIETTIARGQPWQNVFDRLRPQTIDTWMRLPDAARARFLRHLRPYWDAHRHRMAPHIHTWVEAMRRAGSLRVLAGRITHAARADGAFAIDYAPRGERKQARIQVDHIVNCTGPCADLTKVADPLIRQLLGESIAHPHATGLGLDVEASGRVISAAGKPQARLFALGPLTQGAFWETTAVPEIRANAAAMAKTLIAMTKSAGPALVGEAEALARRGVRAPTPTPPRSALATPR